MVWWEPGTLSESGRYELCIDGECETVEPARIGGEGRLLGVAPAAAIGESEVDVRLIVDDGGRTRELRGSGTKTGSCCPGVELTVDDDELVVRPIPD